MFRLSLLSITLLSVLNVAFAATADQWAGRTIYQVITDRFARTDGSTTAVCNTGDRVFCGGSWRGIINKLDYIQGLGADAVSVNVTIISFTQLMLSCRYGFRLLSSKSTETHSMAKHTTVGCFIGN
jgi:hypothetical protein